MFNNSEKNDFIWKKWIATLVVLLLLFSACSRTSEAGIIPASDVLDSGNNTPNAVSGAPSRSESVFQDSKPEVVGSDSSKGSSATLFDTRNSKKSGEKEWTVMIYMVGSDLESHLCKATFDIMELEAAGIDYERSNIVLYTGGTDRWSCDIPADRNCVYDLSLPEGERVVAETGKNVSMGDAETFASFINYCYEHYPAKHTMLVCWDHGGGPLSGYGNDELFDGDSLLLEEMKDALEMTPYAEGASIDIVGFDACLMGSLESMTVWKDYADYYLASEESEPGDGWDYSTFSALNDISEPLEMAKTIIDGYKRYYEKSTRTEPTLTLSLSDLSEVEKVSASVNELAEAISRNLGVSEYTDLLRKRSGAKSFGNIGSEDKNSDYYIYDLVDLCDFSSKLSDSYPDECAKLESAVHEMVCYQYANTEGAAGISIYFPSANKKIYNDRDGVYRGLTGLDAYNTLLTEMGKTWKSERTRDWVLGEPKMDKDEITLKLTSDQLENTALAEYAILQERGGLYHVIACHCSVEPDMEGVLHVPADPYVICFGSNRGSFIGQMRQLESGRRKETYSPLMLGIMDTLLGTVQYNVSTTKYVDWITPIISLDTKTGETEVTSIEIQQDNEGGIGKNDADLSKAEGLIQVKAILNLAKAKDQFGNMLPYNEWISKTSANISTIAIGRELPVFSVKASELSNVYIQIQLTDTRGERYASKLIRVKESGEYRLVEKETSYGKLSYAVYSDHAELVEYEGKDKNLTLPDNVEEVPLTVIGDGAFGSYNIFAEETSDCQVEKIKLPDTIEEIGAGAFLNCEKLKYVELSGGLKYIGARAFGLCRSMDSINLPEGVTEIGKCAFAYCSGLRTLSIPSTIIGIDKGIVFGCSKLETIKLSKNSRYIIDNGALISADGEDLIAYPPARQSRGVYHVKEGTKRIDYGAFWGAKNMKISFPDSVEEIENYAFFRAEQLEIGKLPNKLKRIGEHAFASSDEYGIAEKLYMLDNYSFDLDEDTDDITKIQKFFEDVDTYKGICDLLYDSTDINNIETEIVIGPEVSYIGKGAFDMFQNRSFSVDERNRMFSSKDGNLMNKAGDALVQFANSNNDFVTVPKGTVSLCTDAFSCFKHTWFFTETNILHVLIPDSVIRFTSDEWEGADESILFHCSHGSEAERYAIKNNLEHTADMEVEHKDYTDDMGNVILMYHLYRDHAVLVGLSAKNATEQDIVVLPDNVQGLPVTAVGDGKYSLISYAEEHGYKEGKDAESKIVLPETITDIRDEAFNSTLLSNFEIVLPGNMKYIGKSALAGLRMSVYDIPESLVYISPDAFNSSLFSGYLEGFRQKGDNEHYKVIDGVLYSGDSSELIICPPRGKKSITVPEGTVSIGERSFFHSKIENVSFPKSLRVINKEAFLYCSNLKEINLPEGLSVIGESAFSYCESLTKMALSEGVTEIGKDAFRNVPIDGDLILPESVKSIGDRAFYQSNETDYLIGSVYIGKTVFDIGDGAFEGRLISGYKVSEENLYYKSIDGFLTDRTGRVLYGIPNGVSGKIYIPDLIHHIADYSLNDTGTITDIYFPSTVEFIGEYSFDTSEPKKYPTIHAIADSCVIEYAKQNELPYEITSDT